MTNMAAKNLAETKLDNITLTTGNAAQGWPESAPYDVIVISGSVQHLSNNFKKDLNVGGRIFAFIGDAPAIKATLLTKISESEWKQETLYETNIPRLLETTDNTPFNF
jgi:protein-L-isoaspartate(D-aspartate) O-methyltransferase